MVKLVNTVNKKDVTPADLVFMMVGRTLDHYFPPLGKAEEFGEVVLQVKNASNQFLKDISFELRKGEVLGIAGLQGSGRTEMAQALFGVVPFKTGTMELHGKRSTSKAHTRRSKIEWDLSPKIGNPKGFSPNNPSAITCCLTVRSIQSLFGGISKDGIRKVPQTGAQPG